MNLQRIGWFFLVKYLRRKEAVGTYHAALQMRKQGVPVDIALAVLARS